MCKKKYFFLFFFIIYYFTDFHENINIFMKNGIICMPIICSGDLLRIISSIFIHYNFIHLISNCVILFILNILSNKLINNLSYIYFFMIASIISNIISLFLNNSNILITGASGGVYGIIGALYISINTYSQINICKYFNLILFLNFFFISQIILPFSFLNDNYLHFIGFISGIFLYIIKINIIY